MREHCTRRDFFKRSAATGTLLTGMAWAQPAPEACQHVRLSEVGSSRATGYAEANKIVTVGDRTHLAWLDSPSEGFRVRVRTLDRMTGEWSPVYTVGEGYDNHGGPALTVDSEGYLHIAYYPHHHPMRYRRSMRPNDASSWEDEETIGAHATYPTLVCAADDTLVLTFRVRKADAPWVVEQHWKPKSGSWQGPQTILQAEVPGYAHFMEALAWGPDKQTLHLACRLYDGTPGRGHTIGYLQNKDAGRTWSLWDGTPVRLPATAATLDVVEQSRFGAGHGLRAGAIAVSPAGEPFILCSDYDRQQAWLSVPGPSGWTRRHIPVPPDAPPGYGLITPGGLTFSEDGSLHVVLTLVAAPETGDASLWGHPSCEIAVFTSSDEGRTFQGQIITELDPALSRWLPSMERPTGHNTITGKPGIIFTEGSRGADNTQRVSNNVFWAGC